MKWSNKFKAALLASLLCQSAGAVPLRVLAWDADIAAMKLALGGSKGSTVIDALHPSKRTRTYDVSGGEKPVVVEALDKKDADGKPSTTSIKIPEGVTHPLLVILPDPKASSGVRLLVLEDDATAFPWGSDHFINATGRKLAVVREEKSVVLPASPAPVQADVGGAARNLEVKMFFEDQIQRPFFSAIWEHDPEQRTLIFLVPGQDPRLGPVALKVIAEDRRQNATEEAEAKATASQP